MITTPRRRGATRGEVAPWISNLLIQEGIPTSTRRRTAIRWAARSQRANENGDSTSRAKAKTGSHVLEAMQLSKELVNGTVRISFGRLSTDADADALIEAMPVIVEQLRALGV